MSLPDPSFLVIQCLNGLTYAMFLFLMASGLSLIFGVLGILNFAHGSLYMLGAYFTHQFVSLFVDIPGQFWWAVIFGSLAVAVIGVIIERFFLRHLYVREELNQLLFTYALVLSSVILPGSSGALISFPCPDQRSSRGRSISWGSISRNTTS